MLPVPQPAPAASGEAGGRGVEHLRLVVSHAPIVLFELDRDGVFTLSEGRALEAMGRAPGQSVGLSVFEMHAGHPEILDAVRRSLAGETVRRLVTAFDRAFDVTYTPVHDGRGAVARVVGVAHDVTELHERTEALRESEARLRDFAGASSDWLWETDAEHRFVWFSRRFEEALGFDPAASLGRRRLDFRAGDPADGDWDGHARLLAAHQPFRDFRYGFVDDLGRRRVVSVSGVPITDAAGAFRGHRGTAHDITREVEAEERLRASEARFRSLVTNMRDIIFCRGVAGTGRHG